jgi:chromosome partitioning protein
MSPQAKIICLAQHKGGTGKTTATLNIAACLVEQGRKVLIVDLDPQSNLTTGVGFKLEDIKISTNELFTQKETEYGAVVLHTPHGFDLLPANISLTDMETKLSRSFQREMILARKLNLARDNYDFILLDTPPSLGILTMNAVCVADYLLIPAQLEAYCFDGLAELSKFMLEAQQTSNPNIRLLGVFASRYDKRENTQTQLLEHIQQSYKKLSLSPIRDRAIVHDAALYKKPVAIVFPNSESAQDYKRLTTEVLNYVS